MVANITVITVNYCTSKAILRGLDEVVRQLRTLQNSNYLIVDNASPDGSADELKTEIVQRGFEDVIEVIDAGRNGGFGFGNNIGFQRSQSKDHPAELLLFLNPDAVLSPNSLERLAGFLDKHADAAAVAPVLVDDDGTRQTSFFRFPGFWSEFDSALSLGFFRRLIAGRVVSLPVPEQPEPVDWVTGACFMTRASVYKQLKGFDETFFLYFEEVELFHRYHLNGHKAYAVPDIEVQHTGGVSTGLGDAARRRPGYWFQSRNYFFRKTRLGGPVLFLNLAVAFGYALRRLHHGIRGRKAVPPYFLRDLLRHLNA